MEMQAQTEPTIKMHNSKPAPVLVQSYEDVASNNFLTFELCRAWTRRIVKDGSIKYTMHTEWRTECSIRWEVIFRANLLCQKIEVQRRAEKLMRGTADG